MKAANKKSDSSSDAEEEDATVYIYDRRKGDKPAQKIRLGGIFNFNAFQLKVQEVLNIGKRETFVIVNTHRQEIRDDKTYEDLVEGEETLYIMKSAHQELCAPTQERVEYIPHYDTLVKSGMYEYYASEGQNPLPFAFAELIDNALAATSDNTGPRTIEIRLLFDESVGKQAICVLDNGGGMNSRDLNNWAIYRLSKFNKRPSHNRETSQEETPRSLNSDISYFGVGGKQAIFFIGSATRMVTRTKECADVHELCISTEEFERREKKKESIYSGTIRNRRPGDDSHIPSDDENVKKLIREELNKDNFTAVVITNIAQAHVHYLKTHFNYWCKQLVHIYHYYLHGPRGNEKVAGRRVTSSPFKNIDLQVILHEKGKQPRIKSLREVETDLQTLYIQSAASVFEFRARVENAGVVEGVLRYHPFLYDKETYPALEGGAAGVATAVDGPDEDGFASERDSRAPRGYRPIFECYWNGRLIPYTMIDMLEWCQPPKKRTSVPPECYNRFSGVLWTNDAFQVSTNKLTFMDLEVKLKDKLTIFNRVILGQEQRVQIARAFHDWIRECHELHDKQVKFINYRGQIKRPDLPQKRNQSPWSVFGAIEWDGKVFKEGQLIRTQRTLPLICGTVKRFLLFGDHDGDVFATGGEMEITQEPVSIFGETKIFPLARLDRSITTPSIRKFVEEEEAKLPHKIVIEWPENDKLEQNSKVPAGATIGAMKVDILSGKGESISKLPGDRRKLLIELKVTWHGNDKEGDKVIANHVCQHGGKNWPYWFRKMENITNLGPHTLQLLVLLSDSASAPLVTSLPTHRIKFTVTEGRPEKFTVGMLDNPLRVGVPFQIPLNLLDGFNNPSKPTGDMVPVLSAHGLTLSHSGTSVKGNSLIVKGVTAVGAVPSHVGKDFNLKVTLPGLEEDSQSLKIRLLPGPPETLAVTPASGDVTMENGSAPQLQVEVHDKAGNVTVQPRLNVVCKLTGSPGLPTLTGDCSSSGRASLSGAEIRLKSINKAVKLKARIELQHHKEVAAVEKTLVVMPSTRAARLEVFHKPPAARQRARLEDGQELACIAGETLSGLSCRVLDEGNRELNIDNSVASRMKVNWVAKANKELIRQGVLPDVKAPTSCDEPKYCQVSLSGPTSLELSFTIKPQAGPPGLLRCTCADPKMRLGEPLKAETLLSVADQHGNKVAKLPNSALPEFHVSGDGLLENDVELGFAADGNIVIKNIHFDGGPLGIREVKIKWKKLECYLRVEVVAGAPQALKFVEYDSSEPVAVFNSTQLPSPLTVQLCDAQGNECAEGGVKVVLNTDRGIKLTPTPSQVKTDPNGQATFGQLAVSAQRGMYGIRIKALLGRTQLEAPTLSVRVEHDPSKPTKLNVTFDSQSPCVVGELLPEVSASVIAEDGTQMKAASGKDLVLKIWLTNDGTASDKPPARATTLYPSRKGASDKQGVFHFRDLKVPDVAGSYCMVVQYGPSNNLAITSKPVTFTAAPGPPVKLEPKSVPPTPTVSNTQLASRRVLVKNLRLQLKDKFDNATGETLRGRVSIKVACPSDTVDETPTLDAAASALELALSGGAVEIPSLMIREGSAGRSGQEYLLNFSVRLPSGASPHPIPPFTLAFLFYNDVRKQQQMSQLTKERDHLFETIRTYRSLFDTTRQLINEMQVSVHEASMQEQKLRGELRKQNVAATNLATNDTVQTLARGLARQRDTIASKPRRQCLLHPGPRGDPAILGKVAHLAQVCDDDVARVLSWHMASDMDCVITLTTEKAKQVYRDFNGQQQVLPLDSIYRRSLPDWNKPLPHTRAGHNTTLPGNPVYARDMLLFPAESDNCKIVFGMLLGDTIILDNLDSANRYRQEVVKHSHCPTLLARTGDRIRSNGKFGGLQNKAPHLDKMRGSVFAAPLPMEYHTLSTQIDQLHAFRVAMVKHSQAKEDLSLQLQRGQTEEMKIKHRECREAEAQLRVIEQRLGMTPTQYDMPASPATMLHTELSTPPSRTVVSRRAARGTGATHGGGLSTSTPPVRNGTAANGTSGVSDSPASRTRRANAVSPLNSKRPRRS